MVDQSDAARVERFCQEYLVDHNGKQAAIRAGYSPRSAHVQASRMLSRIKVKERLAELELELKERTSLSAELVREGFKRIVAFTPKMLVREDGSYIPLHELPDEVSYCISAIDYDNVVVKNSDGSTRIERCIKKLHFWNKNQALDTGARITGLIKDPKLVVDVNPMQELMDRIGKNGSGFPLNPLPSGRYSRG